jgi:hypothetical protein
MKTRQFVTIIFLTLLISAPILHVSGKPDQNQNNPFTEILTAIDELGSISVDLEPVLQTISDALAALTASIEASRDAIMSLIEDTQTETIDEIQDAITASEQATATAIDEAKDEAMNTMMTASRLFELSDIELYHVDGCLEISVSCDKPFIIKSIQLVSTYTLHIEPTLEMELQIEAPSIYEPSIIYNYDMMYYPIPNARSLDVFYIYGIHDGISCPGGTSLVIKDNFRTPAMGIECNGVYVIIESALNATPSLTVELGPW